MAAFDPGRYAREQAARQRKANGHAAAAPTSPRIWSARELLDAEFPEPRWLIPDLLPEGLTILAGRPKLGKSWLAFDWGTSLATASPAFGSIECDQADVLILALEDSARRVQVRLRALGVRKVEGLSISTAWPRTDEGGIDLIQRHLDKHPRCRLVIADTLAKIRPRTSRVRDAYAADVEALEPMQRLAGERSIGLLVPTHTRKAAADDWLDSVAGTSGITGTADSIIVLKRERGQADAFLLGDGRDMPDYEVALKFDAGRWRKLDMAAPEARATIEQAAIIDLMRTTGNVGLLRSQIAKSLDRSKHAVSGMLGRMEQAGIVERNGSFWRLTVG